MSLGRTEAGGGGARESRMWATQRSRDPGVAEGVRRRGEGVGFGGGLKSNKEVEGECDGGGREVVQVVRARREDSARKPLVQAAGCEGSVVREASDPDGGMELWV